MGPVKRSIMIAGHATSISLEPVFWDALREAAAAEGLPLNALVARIDAERIDAPDPPNLASAIRVWLFEREGAAMSVELNHTIIWCSDKARSAAFMTGILGLPPARTFLHFLVVDLANQVSVDFYQKEGAIAPQHYAFLVGEAEFDAAFARIEARGLTYWADPARTKPGEINTPLWRPRPLFRGPRRAPRSEIITTPYGDGPP